MRAVLRGEGGRRRLAAGVAPIWALIALVAGSAGAAGIEAPLIGGRFEGYGIVAFDDSSPRQRPLARLDLSAQQEIDHRFSWYISFVGRWGGAPENPRVGAFALDRTFQNYSPSLEFAESYVDFRGDRIDLRIGLQKFFWGQLDSIQPNDLLSPREYEDPFLLDAVDRKIAVPALRSIYYADVPDGFDDWLAEPTFTLVWQPISVPWRFPLLGERWYPPTGTAAPSIEVSSGDDLPGCPCRIDIRQETVNAPAPARRFDNGNVAVRMAARVGDVDWSMMFWDGYDTSPAFEVPIRLTLGAPGDDGRTIGVADTQVRPAYRRFQAIGTDFAFSIDRFTIRGEGNWRFRRPYSMDLGDVADRVLDDPAKRQALLDRQTIVEPAFVQRDSLAWGLGADTILAGTLSILEVYQLVILNNDQPLLVQNVDTRLAANLSRGFLRDRMEAELIGIWGIESSYGLVRATVGYDVVDGVELYLGALGIWGRERSLVGQFRRNSELFGGVRYYF